MPSSKPLDPKATVFTPGAVCHYLSQQKPNPKAPIFVPSQPPPKRVQNLLKELQVSYDSYRFHY